VKLTKNEIIVLEASRITDFGDAYDLNGTWSFAVQDICDLNTKSYGGVVASLVKKGLVTITDNEGKGRFRDMIFRLTDKGASLFNGSINPIYKNDLID
jgi:hypothetical protein